MGSITAEVYILQRSSVSKAMVFSMKILLLSITCIVAVSKGQDDSVNHIQLHEQIGQLNQTLSENDAALLAKIEEMNAKLDELFHVEQHCKDGIMYKDTCIFAVIQDQFDYDTSQSICQSRGGHLAYIDSEEKFYVVNYYLRKKLVDYYQNPNYNVEYYKRDFWWGATYKGHEIILNNGEKSSWAKWFPGYPNNDPSYTNMGLAVDSDPNDDTNGLWNIPPTRNGNPLCQKDI